MAEQPKVAQCFDDLAIGTAFTVGRGGMGAIYRKASPYWAVVVNARGDDRATATGMDGRKPVEFCHV